MNPHGIPYLRFIFPFVIGLAWGAWSDRPLPGLAGALLLSAGFGVLIAIQKIPYRLRWVFGFYVHVWLLGFGYYHIVQHNELRQDGHFAAHIQSSQYFIGTVYEAPSRGRKAKVAVQIEAAGYSPDSLQSARGNAMLFLDLGPFADSVHYGDRLGFHGTLRPTEPPKNPYAFDYARYLHFQNIHHQAFVRPDSICRLSEGHGWLLWQKAYRCRDHLLSLLRQHFPSTNEYAVASALLLGYTDDLSEELRTAYAETGSMHALAVSGTHIGMLYVGLMFLIGRLRWRGRRGKLLETALVLVAIWAFTFLTGATASVLRASVMFSVYMLGKAFWREASAWNVLPASAFMLLVYNPYLLFNVGFQLSYAAVAGMVFFYPRFYKMFPPLPRWLDEPLQVFLVGVAAQLGTLPLSLFYFNQFPLFFWLAGWVVVFVGAVFLWGGAMLVVFDALSKSLAEWLGTALYYMVLWMNKIIFLIQNIPGGVLRNVWVPAWAVGLMYVGLACIAGAMLTRRGKWIGAFVGVMVVLGLYRVSMLKGKQTQYTTVVYSVNKARLIDFFDGDEVFSLTDTLSGRQELFVAQASRTTLGMREKTALAWADTTFFQGKNLFVDWPFVQFYHQQMVLVDDAHWVLAGHTAPVPVDVLILSKSPRVSIAECRARFPFGLVIFDASNAAKQTGRWREECEAEGWAYHDVRAMGAWVNGQQ